MLFNMRVYSTVRNLINLKAWEYCCSNWLPMLFKGVEEFQFCCLKFDFPILSCKRSPWKSGNWSNQFENWILLAEKHYFCGQLLWSGVSNSNNNNSILYKTHLHHCICDPLLYYIKNLSVFILVWKSYLISLENLSDI